MVGRILHNPASAGSAPSGLNPAECGSSALCRGVRTWVVLPPVRTNTVHIDPLAVV